MINKFIHALSNRMELFNTPSFVADPGFSPFQPDPMETAMRQALLLDRIDTDYYLHGYVACLEAFPDMRDLLEDDLVTYDSFQFRPAGVDISGGEFLSVPGAVGYYTDEEPLTLPVAQRYDLDYFDSTMLRISLRESGHSQLVGYTISGPVERPVLRPDWSPYPFVGPVEAWQEWKSMARISIEVTPSRFPYHLVAARMERDPWCSKLMIDRGFVDEFHAVPDPQRKVALACVALALNHPSIYARTSYA
jgi:hypothetical protein